MTGATKAEHVCLHVDDIERAAEFYGRVFGLTELARRDDTIYYGCGLNENFDLAISEGNRGVEHVAVRVSDESVLTEYEDRLAERNVEFERTDNAEPGQERGLKVRLPSHLLLELVTVADRSYRHSDSIASPDRDGIAPLDLDHYNFLSPVVKEDAEFMRDVLDFRVSETVLEDWSGGAFLRKGDTHHDIALFELPGTPDSHAGHHHTAFTVRSVDHMVQLIDRIRQAGLFLELGIGRHFVADTLYAYFQAPDGHRIELSAQMAELDEATQTAHVESVKEAITAWRDDLDIPDSFMHGSGLADRPE